VLDLVGVAHALVERVPGEGHADPERKPEDRGQGAVPLRPRGDLTGAHRLPDDRGARLKELDRPQVLLLLQQVAVDVGPRGALLAELGEAALELPARGREGGRVHLVPVAREGLSVRVRQPCHRLGLTPPHSEAEQVGVLLRGDGRVAEKLDRGHVVDAGDPDRALRDLRRPRERRLRPRKALGIRVCVDVRDTGQRRAQVLAVEQHLGRRAVDLRLLHRQRDRDDRQDQRREDDDPLVASDDRQIVRKSELCVGLLRRGHGHSLARIVLRR
jgi:hypothetical protein